MNKAHEACGSDEWRQAIREVILPWAMGETDLGDNVLEVGPGYGATTDVLSQSAPRLTSVEIDDKLAAMLTERFADVPSVRIVHGDATSLQYADDSFTGADQDVHGLGAEEYQICQAFGSVLSVAPSLRVHQAT